MTDPATPGFTRFHNRVRDKARDVTATPVLIVAFGDSVTQGRMEFDVMDPDGVYHAHLRRTLEAASPLTTFSVLNAGMSGQTAAGALAFLDRDVLRHDPDLVIIGFGLNDAALGGMDGLPGFRQALTEHATRVRQETKAALVLLTPNFTATRDNPRVHPAQAEYLPRMVEIQTGGVVAAYAAEIRHVAGEHGVPVCDAYALWEDFAARGEDMDAHLCNGLNHPGAAMHARLGTLLARLVLKAGETR